MFPLTQKDLLQKVSLPVERTFHTTASRQLALSFPVTNFDKNKNHLRILVFLPPFLTIVLWGCVLSWADFFEDILSSLTKSSGSGGLPPYLTYLRLYLSTLLNCSFLEWDPVVYFSAIFYVLLGVAILSISLYFWWLIIIMREELLRKLFLRSFYTKEFFFCEWLPLSGEICSFGSVLTCSIELATLGRSLRL